ncbi:MAG TPA: transcriptional repressor [Desulfosalsimonadaceae bacterium]|nr:transcriptional repressor [Desulfosalsimonadaceae bacterium]
MTQLHTYEKKQFEKLFKEEHIDNFEDRFKILEAFLKTERHVTKAELLEQLKEQGFDFSPDFVEETLQQMCHFGFAQKVRFENGEVRYEHRHLGQHHDHMICTKCGKIIEFKNEKLEELQSRIVSDYGFHMLQHQMNIYGICSECMETRNQFMPLIMAKPGERLKIKEFIGGHNSRMRLLSMGFRVDDSIEVISNTGSGQLVVALDFNRYVLGRGLAQKIIVEPEKAAEK